jgi:hypothetical protein
MKSKMKRVMSVLIAAAMLMGVLPVLTLSASANIGSHSVQLALVVAAEYPAGEWWQPQLGPEFAITGNGSYTTTMQVGNLDTELRAIMTFGIQSTANASNIPAGWDDPKVKITSVTFNGGTTNHAPVGDAADVDLKAYNASGATGKVDIGLWNAWWTDANILSGVTVKEEGDNNDPGFVVPNVAKVTSVSVQFTVSGLEADAAPTVAPATTTAPPQTTNAPQTGVGHALRLMTQTAGEFPAGSDEWWQPQYGTHQVWVTGNGQFELSMSVGAGNFPILGLAIESAGTANMPAAWDDPKVTVNSVTFNGGTTNFAPSAANSGLDLREYDANGATGKANVGLWNAWWAENRILSGVTANPITNDENGEVSHAFVVPGAANVTSVTVRFTVSGLDTDAPVATTTGGGTVTVRKGAVINGETVTIGDALEILKHLAKLPSEVAKGGRHLQAALIVNPNAPSPTINDALEILKFLAKLDSLVK